MTFCSVSLQGARYSIPYFVNPKLNYVIQGPDAFRQSQALTFSPRQAMLTLPARMVRLCLPSSGIAPFACCSHNDVRCLAQYVCLACWIIPGHIGVQKFSLLADIVTLWRYCYASGCVYQSAGQRYHNHANLNKII